MFQYEARFEPSHVTQTRFQYEYCCHTLHLASVSPVLLCQCTLHTASSSALGTIHFCTYSARGYVSLWPILPHAGIAPGPSCTMSACDLTRIAVRQIARRDVSSLAPYTSPPVLFDPLSTVLRHNISHPSRSTPLTTKAFVWVSPRALHVSKLFLYAENALLRLAKST